MSKCGYSCVTEAAVALVAATAQSVIGVKATADFGCDLKNFQVSFEGITSPAPQPVLVELCYCTFATNSPGTNSTSVTVRQRYGRVLTPGFTAARAWGANPPTVLTVLNEWALTPTGGTIFDKISLGNECDSAFSEGFVFRMTASANVNVRMTLEFERC